VAPHKRLTHHISTPTASHAQATEVSRSEIRLIPRALNDKAISQTFSGGLVL
jgi:hypothetical protein